VGQEGKEKRKKVKGGERRDGVGKKDKTHAIISFSAPIAVCSETHYVTESDFQELQTLECY
jgi:hypothetical protein